MFLLDVSKSMLAEDVKPNRLERAKQMIRDTVDEMSGDRIGLTLFAGEARQRIPMTNHYEEFKLTLAEVGPEDLTTGGSRLGDAIRVAAWLDAEKLDLLEISGGTYEQPRLVGLDDMTLHPEKAEVRRESTIAREAYFLEYAKDIRAAVKMPLMVTGGFRTVAGMNAALASGTMDLVGIARPLCVDPAIPGKLLSGAAAETPAYEKTLRLGPGILGPHSPINMLKALNGWGQQGWFCLQILRMGEGKNPDPKMGVFTAFRNYAKNEARAAAAMQR